MVTVGKCKQEESLNIRRGAFWKSIRNQDSSHLIRVKPITTKLSLQQKYRSTVCSRQSVIIKAKQIASWLIWSRSKGCLSHLFREARLDECKEFVDVRWFKRYARTNVFGHLITNSCIYAKRKNTSETFYVNDTKPLLWLNSYFAVWFWRAQACCWTHSPTEHCQRGGKKTLTTEQNTFRNHRSICRRVSYKLSIIGVEVHILWVSLCRGMDFIRWYMGGQAIRAWRVWELRVRKINRLTDKT